MFNKIVKSRLLRLLISAILIYFAFRKVNVVNIFRELSGVPIKWIILNIIYTVIILMITSYRWSILLFDKVGVKKTIDFTKASLRGVFYGLFFPTAVAGDFLKWLPLQNKYPELTKTKLFSSVFLDRFIGFTAFIFLAFISASIGKILNFNFPIYLFWLFGFLSFGVIVFYFLAYKLDFERIFNKFKFLNKFREAVELLRTKDKNKLIKCILISFLSEFLWIIQVWFVSDIFHAGFTILSVFIFLPVIALILILPISIAGFGAREQLYLFFFSQIAASDEKILLVSTFMGVLGVINSLLGGLSTLIPD